MTGDRKNRRKTRPYPGLNPAGNHVAAAKALATELGWNYGRWVGGDPDGSSVFVCDSKFNGEALTVERSEERAKC